MYTHEENEKEEIRKLRKLSKITKNPRMKLRYNVIRLYLQGYDKRKIAAIFDISYDAVNDYVNSYKAKGIDGLTMGKSTGCPRKLTALQEKQLVEIVTKNTPSDVGFSPFMNWTAKLVCLWVNKEFSVTITERGMRTVFYRLGLSWTRPTYTLKKADPKEQAQFLNDFEELKKTDF